MYHSRHPVDMGLQLTGTIERKASGTNKQVLDKLKVERGTWDNRWVGAVLRVSVTLTSFSQGADGQVHTYFIMIINVLTDISSACCTI